MIRIPIRFVVTALLGGVLAFGAATAFAQTDSFNEKFTFDGETLTDGAETFDNAIIYAGSKQSGPEDNQKQYTNCSYFDEDYNSLGYYADDDFASTDPAAVRDFCLAGFAERST